MPMFRLIGPLEHYVNKDPNKRVVNGGDFECSQEYFELHDMRYRAEFGLPFAYPLDEDGLPITPSGEMKVEGGDEMKGPIVRGGDGEEADTV